ncbi:MAG: aldo/keto reductase [Granulosicoccus sp.]
MNRPDEIIAPPVKWFPEDWPKLGLGCAPMGELFDDLSEGDTIDMLNAAWQSGVRYFDTAPWYGHGLSEHRLGALLRQHARSDYLISTKVGRVYDAPPRGADARVQWRGGMNFGVRYDYTASGFEESLAQSRLRLGQPSVDAVVIHDLDQGYHGDNYDKHIADLTDSGLKWLHELKQQGQISAIGIGINACEDFARLVDWIDVDFFLVAMPYTLIDQDALTGPMASCEAKGKRIIIGAPFASGLLTNPADANVLYNYAPASLAIRDKALRINAVCLRHDVPLMAAALQFPLLHPAVTAVIPGATTAAQASHNMANSQLLIPADLWQELKGEGLIHSDAPVEARA